MGNNDPYGFLETYAPRITYFDSGQARRIDANVAILSHNLITHRKGVDAAAGQARWNVTAAYALIDGRWRTVHHHFSITQPARPNP